MSIEFGKESLHCSCLAEENSDPPECTWGGEPENGVKASRVKTDTLLLNSNPCDLATHCALYIIYYNMGDMRRTHLTHVPVYLSEDVTEGAIYLPRIIEPED